MPSRPTRPASARKPRSASSAESPKKSDRSLGLPECDAPTWVRIARIHAMLNEGRKFNATDIERELEIRRRTIVRTFETMTALEIPWKFEPSLNTYVLTAPCPFLPLAKVESGEGFTLQLVRCMVPSIVGAEAAANFEQLLAKVMKTMAGKKHVTPTAHPTVVCPTALPAAGEFTHLAMIDHAIQNCQELKLLYLSRGKKGRTTKTHVVRPLQVAYLKQRWALVLTDANDKPIVRTYRLDRIQAVALRGKAFVRPADIDIAKRLAGNLGCYTGTGDHEVRILLRDHAADDALTCKWHPSQTHVHRADGTVEITLRLNNLVDIVNEILRWGAQAEALSPPALREAVRDEQRAAAAQYA